MADIYATINSYLLRNNIEKYDTIRVDNKISKLSQISGLAKVPKLELVPLEVSGATSGAFFELAVPWAHDNFWSVEIFSKGKKVAFDISSSGIPSNDEGVEPPLSSTAQDLILLSGRRAQKLQLPHVDDNLPRVYEPHWERDEQNSLTQTIDLQLTLIFMICTEYCIIFRVYSTQTQM